MKPSTSPSLEPPLYTKIQDAATEDQCNNHLIDHNDSTPSNPTAENDSVKELLKKIIDVLETRVHNEEEHSNEDDKEEKMKKDWMLAAAVLDRICAIAVTIVFIGGTVAFFAVFIFHP